MNLSSLNLFFRPTRSASFPGRDLIYRSLFGILMVMLAALVTLGLEIGRDDPPNLFPFFASIALTAWYGGVGPSWQSVALSVCVVDFLFIPPIYQVELGAKDIPWLIAFALCAAVTNQVSLHLRKAETKLLHAFDDLDEIVKKRTAELLESHARLEKAGVEKLQAEERLRFSQQELARVSRILTVGALTASIAHELNQPLAALVANGQAASNWLNHDPPSLPEVRLSVAAVVTSGQRAAEVLARIRNLFIKQQAKFDLVDLNEAVWTVIGMTKSDLTAAGLQIETSLTSQLPRINGDQIQLQQLTLNLLTNAAEAIARAASPQRIISLSTRRNSDGRIELEVADTGPGLATLDEKKVFEPFYSTKLGGTGLGLGICHMIVEQHGGLISAASNSLGGATFRVSFLAEDEE